MQEEAVAAAEAVATKAEEAEVRPKVEDIPSLPPEEHVLTWATMSLTMDPREQQIKWPQPGNKLILSLCVVELDLESVITTKELSYLLILKSMAMVGSSKTSSDVCLQLDS
jgi:hypothetical protein